MQLQFVRIREEHLERLRVWRMAEEVTRYMHTDPEISPEDQNRWYRRMVRDPSRMDWVIRVDGRDVGVGYLFDIDPLHRECFWGQYLGDFEARGKGIGSALELNMRDYAFERLNLHKLCADVLEWNDVSLRAHKRCGFKVEGLLREQIWKKGEYHNVVRMGILRQEWEAKARGKFEYPPAEIEEWEGKKRRLLKQKGMEMPRTKPS